MGINTYAEHIESLYLNRNVLAKMSELSVKKVEYMFNPELQAKSYEDAFNTIVKRTHYVNKNKFDYLPMTIAHRLQSYLKK